MLRDLRALHPNVRVRLVTSFVGKVVGSAIFPLMAIYFSRYFDVALVGLLLGTQYVAQFLAGLYGGHLADVIGRKRLMVAGEVVKLVAFGGLLAANLGTPQPWATFVALLVLAVANGLAGPASDAMLIDSSTPETRSFMYAVNYWGNNLGIMIGAPLGGLLFRDHFHVLVLLLLAASLVILWMTVVLVRETRVPASGPRESGLRRLLRSYREVARDRAFLIFTLSGIAVLSVEFMRLGYVGVRLDQDWTRQVLHLPLVGPFVLDGARALSLFAVENTALIVFGTASVAAFLKGRAPRRWMHVGFVMFALGYAAMCVVTTVPGLLLAGLVLSIGELLYVPTRQALLADMVPADRRGAYMAVNAMIFQVGKWVSAGGLILGPVLGNWGMAAVIVTLGALGIVLSLTPRRTLAVAATD